MAGSIRRQLILNFVLFALALGVLFSAVTLFVFHRVEDRLLTRRLEQLLSVEPGTRPPRSIEYVGPPAAAPAPFAERLEGLAPGTYEWEEEAAETHVLLAADPRTGEPIAAIASFPESELSQGRLGVALAFGVAATVLLALALGRYLALRIVSPIEALTEEVRRGTLDAAAPGRHPGRERRDEIGTLARALERARRELAASAERERRFLREASHELRTPITVIQGVAELLEESADDADSLTRRRLERLGRSIRRMHGSVASLLAIARAEHRLAASDLPPFPQQLDDLIEEARGLARPGVAVDCRLEGAPGSPFAASMLILVLSNLVRNAVEHTRAGGVRVQVEAHRARVEDDGPGLPGELLEQLRSDGPQPDLGIGLAIVQRICRRSGWRLEVECPPGGGTNATVELGADGDGNLSRQPPARVGEEPLGL